MSFTFVFVTKGRKNFEKSLQNCLNLSIKYDYIKTRIVDGNLDNRVKNYLNINKSWSISIFSKIIKII